MTNPKVKTESLSETTKTYLKEWLTSEIYGIERQINSKYIAKGVIMEDEGINQAVEWLNIGFTAKNEESFEDDFFTGTPDMITEDEILDIKCSYDAFSFPAFADKLPNNDYFYQMQVYMHLTGKKSARVVYLLLNTPEEVSPWEQRADYSGLDKKHRYRAFTVNYDPEVIEKLKERVIESRKYIDSLCAQL